MIFEFEKGTLNFMFVVIIPAYKPDDELIKLTKTLIKENLSLLIVDDGSGEEYQDIFAETEAYAKVLHMPQNKGKGAALKCGIGQLRRFYPKCTHFITADSDGQHQAVDIIRVRDTLQEGAQMVLTLRDFGGNVPARSKIGNSLSKWVYTILTGHYLSDNQSGLRGYSIEQIDWLLQVKGEKYDYEMNTLYYADKLHIPITTIPIHSIYIDGNKSSHFTPVRDTLRIYRRLFSSAASSILTACLCEVTVILLSICLGYHNCFFTIPLVGLCSAIFCMIVNGIVFSKVRYRDAWWTLFFLAMRFCVYTVVCTAAGMIVPKIPLWLTFDVTALAVGFGRYHLHKYICNRKNKK